MSEGQQWKASNTKRDIISFFDFEDEKKIMRGRAGNTTEKSRNVRDGSMKITLIIYTMCSGGYREREKN